MSLKNIGSLTLEITNPTLEVLVDENGVQYFPVATFLKKFGLSGKSAPSWIDSLLTKTPAYAKAIKILERPNKKNAQCVPFELIKDLVESQSSRSNRNARKLLLQVYDLWESSTIRQMTTSEKKPSKKRVKKSSSKSSDKVEETNEVPLFDAQLEPREERLENLSYKDASTLDLYIKV